jgi:competence CoiA-like predicted nuclease
MVQIAKNKNGEILYANSKGISIKGDYKCVFCEGKLIHRNGYLNERGTYVKTHFVHIRENKCKYEKLYEEKETTDKSLLWKDNLINMCKDTNNIYTLKNQIIMDIINEKNEGYIVRI